MKWYQNLYVGNTFQKNKKKIMRLVESGKQMPGACVILLSAGEQNQLEILPLHSFYRLYADQEPPLIVGIASGMGEAKDLLVQMTECVYRDTGGAQLREYFSE